jgi:hypothetical protein
MNFGRKSFPPRRPGTRPWLFISYRHRFDRGSARQLTEELERAFGDDTVFWDVEGIEPGDAFPETIRKALEECDAFLLLVSHGWVESAGRLHDPDDFVRREVVGALARGVLFIPVLLGGARMPKADELPEEIRDLAFRQAIELSDARWDYDVGRLLKLIRARTGRHGPAPLFERAAAALRRLLGTWPGRAAAAVVAVAAVYLTFAALARFAIWYESHRDLEGCVNWYAPDVLAGAEKIETGRHDAPVVRADQYPKVLASPQGGAPILVRIADSGQEVGAVFLRFFKAAQVEDGLFKVERVVEPPCADVQQYSNYVRPSADKHVLHNWDTLRVRLGGRDYFLRPGDKGDHIVATLTLTPPE